LLVKGGPFLEMIGRVRTLAFDKTGTLTRGEPDVVEVVPEAGVCEREMLRVAAALGDLGGHVLGRAIARHARDLALEVPRAESYEAVPGKGAVARIDAARYHVGSHRFLDEAGLCRDRFHESLASAERAVGTAVAVSGSGQPMGWIRLADRPRPEAAHVIEDLKGLGLLVVMLPGNNPATAEAVARQLGLDAFQAALLPADKARVIRELETAQGPVGMVGDGVNDAPALAAASVSVALGGISSAAALETADIVLMADDLTALPWLVRHSRRTVRRIWQNIVLAIATKALVMLLAIAGIANLWLAIAADLGVSLLVVANALRLLRAESGPPATRL
jgi:Cd2+/Zn2+-exporting ATPase